MSDAQSAILESIRAIVTESLDAASDEADVRAAFQSLHDTFVNMTAVLRGTLEMFNEISRPSAICLTLTEDGRRTIIVED